MKWRTGFNEKEEADARGNTRVSFEGVKSLTVQDAKDSCDLNVLVRRFGIDGVAGMQGREPLEFGDLTSAGDLRECMDVVREAEDQFFALDPHLRERFHNNPVEMYDFVLDSRNHSEAVDLGILRRYEPPTILTPVVPVEPVVPRD